ncbi:MAG TPA: hypothetical protein VFV83_01380, partial [Chthoniobacteraceae bacterium]|nr:hypothetical protein [Chthoniobacteraceae bacterium]
LEKERKFLLDPSGREEARTLLPMFSAPNFRPAKDRRGAALVGLSFESRSIAETGLDLKNR